MDFVKAFDKINHAYIFEVLELLNFGQNVINLIKLLLKDRKGKIIPNDEISTPFEVSRGKPEGDKTAPILILIALEPLLLKVNYSENVHGVKFEGWEKNPPKLDAYADDANACLLPNMQNILNFGKILDKFFITSGLQ